MNSKYIAHTREDSDITQSVYDHSVNVAKLCKQFAIDPFKDYAFIMGLLHDIGKYQDSFQERIRGNKGLHVDHSTCGAIAAENKIQNPALSYIMEYCISGHHSGLPNGGTTADRADSGTLSGRKQKEFNDYSAYKSELGEIISDTKINDIALASFLSDDCDNLKDATETPKNIINKYAFITRLLASCLIDADSLDTADFCNGPTPKSLDANFKACLDKLNKKVSSFKCETDLQKTRINLQNQVYDKLNSNAEIYLMNMPTGSGKTICSMKFALLKAIKEQKKRIIYVIPYNSIIDQTVSVFEDIFGDSAEILRHQSSFVYDDDTDENPNNYASKAKLAVENWDAKIIITTAVQFFESIYSNKRSKLRKVHNMTDSILIFDEAHSMPINYLQPCLQAISYLTRYCNSTAILLTATMPDFHELINRYCLPNSKIIDLIDERKDFAAFKKCDYEYLGEYDSEKVISHGNSFASRLIIVNHKNTARELYNLCTGKKYHLSTYMTGIDRVRVINEVKCELKALYSKYPDLQDVPEEEKITLVSTSLIEAGVDLDFEVVYRELNGVESILQAGGRCNREGKRKNAKVFIFKLKGSNGSINATIANARIDEFGDISCPESIQEYYRQLYDFKANNIVANTISNTMGNISFQSIFSIPFKDYSENFNIISDSSTSIVVPIDKICKSLQNNAEKYGIIDYRKLQVYTCSVCKNEVDNLRQQGVIEDYGTEVFFLTNMSYYDKDTGINFSARDYFI